MVLGHAGYSLFLDYKTSREAAQLKVDNAIGKLRDDFGHIQEANKIFAIQMTQDPVLMGAYSRRDRNSVASTLKDVILKTGFVGFVSLIDDEGKVFYSTDSPSKSGYDARGISSGVDYVFRNNDIYNGPACYTVTGSLAISSMVPIRQGTKVAGIAVVNQPLNTEFLTGMVSKFAIEQDHLMNIDLALLSTSANRGSKDGTLVAITPGLRKQPPNAFLVRLQERGVKAIPQPGGWMAVFNNPSVGFEDSLRWWKQFNLGGIKKNETEAIILVTTTVPDMQTRLTSVLILAGTVGGIGLLFALLFAAGIAKGVNSPLRFLIRRTNDLTTQKQVLPALEGLSGDWLELGELIDTSVASMRTTVVNLKNQTQRLAAEAEEKDRVLETTNHQLESLNRQYAQQSRQLSEVSKQISFANKQSVMLQQKLDSVLQVSTEGFLVLDQFGNVLSANPVFLHWVGTTEGEIAGRLCFDLVKRPGEPRNSDGHGSAFATHGGNPQELINQFYPEGVVYHRYENKSIEVIAHLQPIVTEDSNIQGYIMVLRDKSLRSEIAQLRTEIVSMLSDTIRQPLVVSEQRWSSVLANAAQTMHPAVGQTLAELHSQYEQLLGVIDSLLMMYGGFVPQPVQPREQIMVTRLVAECLEEMAPLARQFQLGLDYRTQTGLPAASGSKESVKAILLPILERMILVTAAGGRVRVECQVRGGDMIIAVTSSGPALPEHEIADMFVGFVQGKHADDSYSWRLSMYLARNNIERLGGRIWAESGGRGTSIYFTLPVA